jgi:hypothetical protein
VHRAGERDPGSDLVATGAGFGIDFFVRVFSQFGAVAAD